MSVNSSGLRTGRTWAQGMAFDLRVPRESGVSKVPVKDRRTRNRRELEV